MLKIEQVSNGWLLIDETDPENVRKQVFQETDEFNSEKGEAEAFASLLWAIKSIMGPMDSRYSAHRVYITIKPGDKHNDHKDDEDNSVVVS